jgi:hypothetical protein
MPAKTTARDLTGELAFLTRALKAPTLRQSVARLADRARAESWSHEEFLAACLQREVAAREAHGGDGRIRHARFPARKSLEEFDFDHARGLNRDLVAHLGTLDFVAARENVVFLGPPGTGKTHCETGLGDPGACRRTIPGRRGLTRSLIGHRTCALAWSCRPMPSRASLVRLAPVTARRSRVDRWQAGVGNQGRPQRVTGRPRACLRVDLSPRLPAPARPTERWPDQKPVRPRA